MASGAAAAAPAESSAPNSLFRFPVKTRTLLALPGRMSSALLDRPRSASAASFERVYRRHVRDVYRVASGLLGNTQDAEDATQTTFMRAYRALERGERVRNIHAWLLAIARNVCREHFRRNGSHLSLVELDGEATAAPEADGPTATEIRDAMQHLPFNQRFALVLREIEGRSYGEIAAAMELSLPAVETLLFRARRALREQLEASEHDVGCDGIYDLIARQMDGKLSFHERGLLRAHLRSCAPCARLARSERSRRRLMPALAGPLPASLSGAFQAAGGGIVTSKAAALAAAAALAGAGVFVAPHVLPDGSDSAGRAAAQEGVAAESTGSAVDAVSAPSGGLSFTRAAPAQRVAPDAARAAAPGVAEDLAAPVTSGGSPLDTAAPPAASGGGSPAVSAPASDPTPAPTADASSPAPPPAPAADTSSTAPPASPPAAPQPPAVLPSASQQPPRTPPALPPPAAAPGPATPSGETRPGWGYGDENHTHTGPPGAGGANGKP
jgi:RNA polymerase sigma factor (sigma-70 family)